MKKTLQDQYLLIKEGKGHVGVFLAEAKREFPHIVRNAATFDEAVASLKTKNIISENVISVMPAIMDRPKKESYETAFEAFLAEAKKKNEDEKVKAEEKKVSKPVEEDLAHNYDNSDDKNPDNMIFDQIMTGYYAEMKDPKNADKTMQELKDIVFKNLAKDQIYLCFYRLCHWLNFIFKKIIFLLYTSFDFSKNLFPIIKTFKRIFPIKSIGNSSE